ncbi:hypothetical protein KAF25_006746 [Fusarium avenaceum]|uniref:Uncharacterized protein n=1 Tax=Fusarium avenaceum TaxID=40199 RepID=A0A9P7H7U1_9HYPO|nr:hypothetical protein KAF25_006746 [Fusarium avenaceum]
MDPTIKPFAGTHSPESSDKFLASTTASRNEAVIVGGVMIGSVLFVALVGVACMFYKGRVRKIKAREAKTADATDFA